MESKVALSSKLRTLLEMRIQGWRTDEGTSYLIGLSVPRYTGEPLLDSKDLHDWMRLCFQMLEFAVHILTTGSSYEIEAFHQCGFRPMNLRGIWISTFRFET
ncbi:hypothetical protein Tco_0486924 [Tanacetum coccineum]